MMPTRTKWKVALRNLLRQRRRNLISVATIAIAFAGTVLFGANRYYVDKHMTATAVYNSRAGHIAVYKKGAVDRQFADPAAYALAPEAADRAVALLGAMPEVAFVGRYLQATGLVSNGCVSTPFVATGVDTTIEAQVAGHPDLRRWAPRTAAASANTDMPALWRAMPNAIAVTERMAQTLDKPKRFKRGDATTLAPIEDCHADSTRAAIEADAGAQLLARTFGGDFAARDVFIGGHYRTGVVFSDEVGVIAPLALLQDLYDTKGISYLAVYLKDGVDPARLRPRLEARLVQAGLDVEALLSTGPELNMFYDGAIKWQLAVELFVNLLTLGMVVFTVLNFVVMAIIERRQEIGTLRAIGFDPRVVGAILRVETSLVATVGVLFGALVCLAVIFLVNEAHITYRPPGAAGEIGFNLAADAALFATRGAAVLAVAFVSGYVVIARVASKQAVIELLR
jgi:putative ABC transport system permease protein